MKMTKDEMAWKILLAHISSQGLRFNRYYETNIFDHTREQAEQAEEKDDNFISSYMGNEDEEGFIIKIPGDLYTRYAYEDDEDPDWDIEEGSGGIEFGDINTALKYIKKHLLNQH